MLRIVKQCQAVLVGQLRLQKAFEATALMAAVMSEAKYEQHYDFEAVKKETGSLLLMTGQQAIVDAWRACMEKSGGGIGLRFEPLDGNKGRQLLLHVEYVKQGGIPGATTQASVTVSDDVYIDAEAFEVKANAGCLAKSRSKKLLSLMNRL